MVTIRKLFKDDTLKQRNERFERRAAIRKKNEKEQEQSDDSWTTQFNGHLNPRFS